jgi:hypothetical protein
MAVLCVMRYFGKAQVRYRLARGKRTSRRSLSGILRRQVRAQKFADQFERLLL